MAKTIAVDFDGVIHQYSKGWADGSIYDPPIEGAIEGLLSLMDKYAVFVHTTRNPEQVAEWLRLLGISASILEGDPPEFWNGRDVILVTNLKFPAMAYIDDRAYHFIGWGEVVEDFGVVPAWDDQQIAE